MAERSLSMREAPGSIPGLSMFFSSHSILSIVFYFCLVSGLFLLETHSLVCLFGVLSKTIFRKSGSLVLQRYMLFFVACVASSGSG